MAMPSLKNAPLSPAIGDLFSGDNLQSQVQAQLINDKKKKQQENQSNGNVLMNLISGGSPAISSLYGMNGPGFGS